MDMSAIMASGLAGFPSPYVPHDPTIKQAAFLLLPHREAFYGGAAGGGKGQPKEAKVLTPSKGWVPFFSLKVGDMVVAGDGSPTRVLAVHLNGKRPVYEVSFADGAKVCCDDSHRWRIFTPGKNTKLRVMTTLQLIDYMDGEQAKKQPHWPSVPLCQPPRHPKAVLPVPAYTLGVLLGNGHFSSTWGTFFSTPYSDVADRIREEWPDGVTRIESQGDGCERYYLRKSKDFFESLGLNGKTAVDKEIPEAYFLADLDSRWALLHGLMDTDGTTSASGKNCSYSSISLTLAEGVQRLARSLGFNASIGISAYEGTQMVYGTECKRSLCYRVSIWGTDKHRLFFCKAKSKRSTRTKREYRVGRRITEIKYIGIRETRCITVENQESSYVTDGYVVTLNSDALLMAALQYVHVPSYSAIVFRKTLTDLKRAGSLLDRAHSWLAGTPCKFEGSTHTYYFPTRDLAGNPAEPAKVAFGYIGNEGAKYRYQGAEFQFFGFDELTQHSEEDFVYLFSRLRKLQCIIHQERDAEGNPIYDPFCNLCRIVSAVPLRGRATGNPGGMGHQWVKERYAITLDGTRLDPITKLQVPRFVGKNKNRPYIPAFLTDNPHLDQDGYDAGLEELDPVTREQYRNGNWDISPDSRFRPEWFRRYSVRGGQFVLGPDGRGTAYALSDFQRVFMTVDPAASGKEGPGDVARYRLPMGGSWTVIATWGLTPDYQLLLLDIKRFRKEIPEIPKELKKVYHTWRPQTIGMEAVGVGKGAYQLCLKAGLPVTPLHPHNDKIVRSADAQVRAEKGCIWLPQHPGPLWLKPYESELFTWSGHPYEVDDQVDVTSYAANMVSWEAAAGELNAPSAESVHTYGDGPGVVYLYGNPNGGGYGW